MAKPLLTDDVWNSVEPLLPPPEPKVKPGRPRVPDRACLTGILFVLKTGIPWEYLPSEIGCGSGMTCWRRLRDWQRSDTWRRVESILTGRLEESERIDWRRASMMRADAHGRRSRGHRASRRARAS
jgi:transposase